jgi:peptidoglycan/LPS O-acetylase OafA/YrhL
MDIVSPLPAIASCLVAVGTCFFLLKIFGVPPAKHRDVSIDGLRGYLALFVFLHHSCIWFFYLQTNLWEAPPSDLYTHFGQSSVILFFMIAGYLYFSKLIDGRTRVIDWGKLYVSRFLRLVPLYLFVMLLLFLVVAYTSNGTLHVPLPRLLKGVLSWLSFTILGSPDLNGVEQTSIIVAKVTWPLPYWWFFYFSLPVLALIVGVIPPFQYIAFSIVSIGCWFMWQPQVIHFLPFVGGIAASLLFRLSAFRRFAVTDISSCICVGCIASAVIFYPIAYEIVPILLLSMAFCLIACGNNLFGSLTHPISRMLGELSYSIYLLHGITLFVTFNFVIGITTAASYEPITYWLWVIGITPILLCLCFVTFRFLENPAIRGTDAVTEWIRLRLM